jgi:hypothetical protein
MEAVDHHNHYVQLLIILVLLIDHIDVISEHVQLVLIIAQLLMDVIINIQKDVQKQDNVQKLNKIVIIITLKSHYLMDVSLMHQLNVKLLKNVLE